MAIAAKRLSEVPSVPSAEDAADIEVGGEDILEPEAFQQMVAEAAYYRAERRGFAPGNEESDWFEAEQEVRAALSR